VCRALCSCWLRLVESLCLSGSRLHGFLNELRRQKGSRHGAVAFVTIGLFFGLLQLVFCYAVAVCEKVAAIVIIHHEHSKLATRWASAFIVVEE
jgi:hypothetical protein